MTAGLYIAVAAIGYVLGSIPFGLFIGRVFARKDVRLIGSGKIGMTNVMRTAGKKAAFLSLLLDMGKGAASVIFAGMIFTEDPYAAQVLAALAAVAGHSWSVFLGFKGGRGVATFIGGLLAMYWPAALVGGAIMIIVGLISRYMSLGSITGAVAAVIMLIALFGTSYRIEFLMYTIYALYCAVFIILMHRDNISRLVSGTERKLGDKSGSSKRSVSDEPK